MMTKGKLSCEEQAELQRLLCKLLGYGYRLQHQPYFEDPCPPTTMSPESEPIFNDVTVSGPKIVAEWPVEKKSATADYIHYSFQNAYKRNRGSIITFLNNGKLQYVWHPLPDLP